MTHTTSIRLARLGFALLALWGGTRPAAAQDSATQEQVAKDLAALSLEQLVDVSIDSVYAASAYAQKISEAPASVTIITHEDIDRFGYRTLSDVLRTVRGFYITNDRNYSYLGVRGFSRPGDYNARVLLLVDGHRLNDNIFGSALLGTEFPLDVDLIERVEIVRGPSSSLYGTSAFLAVINVVTKKVDTLGGDVQVAGTLGSFGTRRGRVTYGHRFAGGAQMLLSGSVYDSRGQRRLYYAEFDTPETNGGIARDVDDDNFEHFLGRYKKGGLTVQALHGSRSKVVPTASFGTVFGDPRAGTIETQQFVDLQYDRQLGTHWHSNVRAYVDRYAYDGTYPLATDAAPVLNLDFARGLWWGAEGKARRRLARRHTLAVGAEYRRNARQHQYNHDFQPYQLYLDDERSSVNWALFAQDEIKLHDRLLLNVGLRHDQYDTFGGTTNPRGAVIYSPTRATTVKLLYGEAFRAPNAYELFWQQDELGKPNPLLRPETNRTSELVVEHAFSRAVRAGATLFTYRIEDLITQQTDPRDDLLVYNNVERIAARGLELEGEGRFESGLTTRASWTWQHSENAATRELLTNSPAHVAQFLLRSPLAHRALSGGIEARYLSERRTISGGRVRPLFVMNATLLAHHVASGLQVSATMYNLLNRRFADPGSEEHRQDSILQNGRSFRLNVVYDFVRRR